MKLCPTCNTDFDDSVSFCPRDGEVLQELPDNLVGRVLDEKYEIKTFLAQGGMGAVYIARHILLGDRVVIKVLRPDMRQNTEWLRRFQREGRAARSFRHPNAVTVYDMSAATDGLIYMVMEYVEGHTLDKELKRRGRFTPLEALEVLEPVADALDAAHTRGVVHRDMKPENVMLGAADDGESVVKLLDLGIAKMVGVADAASGDATSLTVAGQILGTPFYMSPEQWGEPPRDGNHEVDSRTDIYSLGIIFYELVAGRKPLVGRTHTEVRNEHVRGRLPDLRQFAPEVPEGFVRAVEHALAKDRGDRPQTVREFVNEVRESLGLPARTRARNTKGDVHATAEPSGAGAAGSEAQTASLPQNAGTGAGELSHADTILTSEFEQPAAAAGGRDTSAQPPRPLTNANLAAHGDGVRPTSASHAGSETETAIAASGAQAAAADNLSATPLPRPKRSAAPFVIGGALALVLLAGLGGLLAWKFAGTKPLENPPRNLNAPPQPPPPAPKAEAVSYWIEAFDSPKAGDVRRVAEVSAPLPSGQHFKFHFTPRERGYLYIVGPGGKGNAPVTFLTAQGGGLLKTNLVAAGADFAFPFGEDKVLILDDNPGIEEYTVIFSPSPLLAPAFLTEKNLKELSPAEVKEFEDFRAKHRTAAATLDVNQEDGGQRVAVSVPEDALGQPVIFEIRIEHK